MATVKQEFVSRYLNNKLIEAVRVLNEIENALDPMEKELLEKIASIRAEVTGLEL